MRFDKESIKARSTAQKKFPHCGASLFVKSVGTVVYFGGVSLHSHSLKLSDETALCKKLSDFVDANFNFRLLHGLFYKLSYLLLILDLKSTVRSN